MKRIAQLAIGLLLTVAFAADRLLAADQWFDPGTGSGISAGIANWDNTSTAAWAMTSAGTTAPVAWTNGNNAWFAGVANTAYVGNVTADWLVLANSSGAGNYKYLYGAGPLTLMKGLTTFGSSVNPHGGQGGGGWAFITPDITLGADQHWHLANYTIAPLTGRITGPYTLNKCGYITLSLSNAVNDFAALVIRNATVNGIGGGTVFGGGPVTVGAPVLEEEAVANFNQPSLLVTHNPATNTTTVIGDLYVQNGALVTLAIPSTPVTNILQAGSLNRVGNSTVSFSANYFNPNCQITFTGLPPMVNGILPPWMIESYGAGNQFLTNGVRGLMVATYDTSFNPARSNQVVSGNITLSGPRTAYAYQNYYSTLDLSGYALNLGDGAMAGLLLANSTVRDSIGGGAIDFGTAETFIGNGNAYSRIQVPLYGSGPMVFFGRNSLIVSNSTLYAGGPITVFAPHTLDLFPLVDIALTNGFRLAPKAGLKKSGNQTLALQGPDVLFDFASALNVAAGHLVLRDLASSNGVYLTASSASLTVDGGYLATHNVVVGGATATNTTVVITNATVALSPGSPLSVSGTNTTLKVLAGATLAHVGTPPTDNIGGFNTTWLIDGGVVTNLGRVMIENIRGDSHLILTNGGRMFIMATGGNDNRFGGPGATNFTTTIHAGSLLSYGQSLSVGASREHHSVSNRLVINGGAVSNYNAAALDIGIGNLIQNGPWVCRDHSLIITNGGRLWLRSSLTVGRGGSANTVLNNTAAFGPGSRVEGLVNSLSIVIGTGSNVSNSVLSVDGGGLADGTVVSNFFLQVGIGCRSNSVSLANGARFINSTINDTTIGNLAAGINNRLEMVGAPGAPTTFDMSGRNFFIGSSANSNTVVIGADARLMRTATLTVGLTASNNCAIVLPGGVLEASALTLGAASAPAYANTLAITGGVIQFTTAAPVITRSANAANTLDNGVFGFSRVANANVKAHLVGTLTNIVFSGDNAFRLYNATNGVAASQSYWFDTGLGVTNFVGLEMVEGGTAYTNGSVTTGPNGWLTFSNTTAVMWGAVTNYGALAIIDSTVTFKSGLWLAEGCTVNWSTNAVNNAVTVEGALALPETLTFNVPLDLEASDRVTLLSATGGITGSPAAWTIVPSNYRVSRVGNTLELFRLAAGTVLTIR